ncbi:MAG: N-(5'-phosphoribosyl)anthranilate isomerase, partial [Gemmatimonadetes bacterium]|nr:phosphoribosylanthranilate isomerase [Gemmatimonadota bacterium]NIU77322.1 N-(5'-phosphoribosyl)anthranilate isomerase [Gammaproteobacteria bacterium]NIP81668.1 phosphoribosylanthranilate isomerase [Gemmatimonadota bacterium]NIQ57147.1 phosphoribosylanthranilate isomerase [Gemmatimonadota bacterium]NIX46583.1 N-(5'-phosphoribosyl)anthranilate isomerase [Gemmatimonadota bacterium]
AQGARKVGVYVDATVGAILREAERFGLDVVQLHGHEGPERVEALQARGLEVWKVVKPERAEQLLAAVRRYQGADLLLIEGRSSLDHGGVGARFPWAEIAAAMDRVPAGVRLGVGGGLTPENVARAIRRFRPALVDVSSGVEVEPCRKDPERVRAFIRSVIDNR